MKKTFPFNVPNKKPDRQLDTIRHEIKKYIARERRKAIPEGADFWDFDCRMGPNQDEASVLLVHEIPQRINQMAAEKAESFYLEILAKPGFKPNKKSNQ